MRFTWRGTVVAAALALGLSAPFIGPAILGGGGGPTFTDCPYTGPYLLDTRAGGAQDVTAAASLVAAEAIAGTEHQGSTFPIYWTTVGPLGTGHNWGFSWDSTGVGNNIYIGKAGLTITGLMRIHYKLWRGKVAADGVGIGGTGLYPSPDSHKWGVILRRGWTGGGSVNSGRSTMLNFTSTTPVNHGAEWTFDSYVHASGHFTVAGNTTILATDIGGLTATKNQYAQSGAHAWTIEVDSGASQGSAVLIDSNTASPAVIFYLHTALAAAPNSSLYRIYDNSSSNEPSGEAVYYQDNCADLEAACAVAGVPSNIFGGVGIPNDLTTALNTELDVCMEINPESAPGAGDGRLRERYTFGGTTYQVFDIDGSVHPGIGRTGDVGLPFKEIQIIGPTWGAVLNRAGSGYMSDFVIEHPASPMP